MKKIGELIDREKLIKQFRGFHSPNTTQTPDEIFDLFLPDLKHSELKVLLYIVRRTYGFYIDGKPKGKDRISLKQICQGITKKTGERLDYGTGLTKRGAINAIQSLEKRGLITVERVRTKDGYNKVNVYSLRMARVVNRASPG